MRMSEEAGAQGNSMNWMQIMKAYECLIEMRPLDFLFCKKWSIIHSVYARQGMTWVGFGITNLEQGRSWTVEWWDILLFHSLTHLLYEQLLGSSVNSSWLNKWPFSPKEEKLSS